MIGVWGICLWGGRIAEAQLPATRLEGIFPAGAAPNSTVEVVISGTDLDDVNRLLFSHPGITAKQKMAEPTPFDEGPQPVENRFLVTLAGNVPPGNYEVRCQGKYGLSNPRMFVVGERPELIETEPNGGNQLPRWTERDDGMGGTKRENLAMEISLPVTVNGESSVAADVDWYRFSGKAGQRVLLEGYARRIDSRMDLVLTLFDANGRMLGENRVGQDGDPLVDSQLPADGEYYIKVHDSQYRQGTGYIYRLNVGVQPHLDFLFPPAGLPGSNGTYTIYGRNLPGGRKSPFTVDGRPLEMIQARIAIPSNVVDQLTFSGRLDPQCCGMDGIEYRIKTGPVSSNPLLVTAASAPVVLEQPNNDRPETPQQLKPPCEVAGQFYPQRDIDWYSFEAKQGEIWAIDLYSHRLNLPTDPVLLLQQVTVKETGEEEVRDIVFLDDVAPKNVNNRTGRHEFDHRTTDPFYLFTVPADGTYRLMVKDGYSSVTSDPRLVYRLAIRQPSPDFRIVAVPGDSTGSLLLRKGGRDVVRIFVDRRDGYQGEIRVKASGLPNGVTSEEITIGPLNTIGTLVLTASASAPASIGTLQITAQGTINGKTVTRRARYGAALQPFQFNQPNANIASVPARFVERIQVCVSEAEPAPQVLSIGSGKVIETSRGGIVKIPYQVKRQQGTGGSLAAFPTDVPLGTTAPQVNIGGQDKGEFELRFQAATPPGTYTIYLAGFNRGLQYKRNPEEAERAKKRQERIAQILKDAQQKTQQAQQIVQQRQKELDQANAAVTQAERVKQQTSQALKTAQTAVQQATAALKQREAQAAANPDDAGLKTQVQQAQTALAEAQKKQQEAKTADEEAAKKLTTLKTQQTAAGKAKAEADQQLKEAQTFQQQAQQEKQRADQYANRKKSEANPRGFNVRIPSNTITVKIAEFPLKIDTLPESMTVKQGEKASVPIKITRLYGFQGNVSVQTQLPRGVSGIVFQNLTIPGNQPNGQYDLTVQPNATVGTHECTVNIRMTFNGQSLTMQRPLKVTVVEVKPQK